MNTRRGFVRSMLGAAALPFAALTKHAGAHEAVVSGEYFELSGDRYEWDYTASAEGFVNGYPDESGDVLTARWPQYSATSVIAYNCEVVRVEQLPGESDADFARRVDTARAAVQATVNRMNLIQH